VFNVQRGRKSKSIRISAEQTLDDLDNEIKGVYNFEKGIFGHLSAFFMDGRAWSHNAYWRPYNDDGPFTDEVKLYALKLKPGHKFLYLYDFGDERTVNVTFLGEEPAQEHINTNDQK